MTRMTLQPTHGLISALAAMLVAASVVGAQTPADPAPSAPRSEKQQILDRNHKLAPGDTVQVLVARHEQFSGLKKLFADGTIEFPIIGAVTASGLTPGELAAKIIQALKAELRRPRVSVSLVEIYVPPPPAPKVYRITVLGAVGAPGVLDMDRHMFLREVLAKVSPTDRADLSQIRINYPDGAQKRADMSAFKLTGASPDDLLITGGEEIIVVERVEVQEAPPVRVRILGQVAAPKDYTLPAASGILTALAEAGEPTPKAELRTVTVTGPAHKEPKIIDVEKLMAGDIKSDYVLQDGDIIVVDAKPILVALIGDVAQPGELAVRKGKKVSDLVRRGIFNNSAALSKALLLRKGEGEEPERFRVNIKKLLKGNAKFDYELQTGDTLYVPSRKQRGQGVLDQVGRLSTPFFFLSRIFTGGLF